MTLRPLEISLCTLVMAVAATGVYGQCNNDAGVGDLPEAEPCALDENNDTTNGGCNSSPPVFTTVPSLPITYCGTASNHNNTRTCDEDLDCDTDGDGIPDGVCNLQTGLCEGPNEPSVNRRDTDWYRVPASVLALGDGDGNGVVRITSNVVGEPGIDLVTFVLTGDFLNTCTAAVVGNVGCWDSTGGTGGTQGDEIIVLSENPDGVVVFVAPGLCSGGTITNGFECTTGLNDYLVTIQADPVFEDGAFIGCGDPAQNPLLGPCNEANPGVGGCEDPACCKLVCAEFNPLCCQAELGWTEACADVAVDLRCAPEGGGRIRIATGPDEFVDGFLAIAADPYGTWSSDVFGGIFGGIGPGDPDWGDEFNPADAGAGVQEVSFTNGFFLFNAAAGQRELLSNIFAWQNLFAPDDSLFRQIVGEGSLAFDDNSDGVLDRLESTFIVTGIDMDLTFDLTQQVESLGAGVAILTQQYTITNNFGAPVDFVLLRAADHDLVWAGNFEDDSVGTNTNGSPLDRFVFQGEVGLPGTAVTLSSPQGNLYYGAKRGIDPDGAGPGPNMGAGTSSRQWNSFGVPIGWENFIAGIGADMDGVSGAAPAGCTSTCDGSIGLEIPVSLQAGATTTITITHTYGAAAPVGPGGPCGGPLAGTCYGINPTPACSDAACCQLVCASNPLCCAGPWDITCFLAALGQCDLHQVIFGFTPDDFGASNDCAGGATILTTQYVNTHSVVFGTAVDNFSPPVVVIGDHAACIGTCRSFGQPVATKDWWCQFRLGDGPGLPGALAGVTSVTAEMCLITAPIGTVVLEGYDIDLAVVATATSTQIGAEALTLTAPPQVLISYVRVIAGDPGQALGLSVAWIDYPQPVEVVAIPCPWDCDSAESTDGTVGIVDFLTLLAQWGGPGSCDFDGGGVGIADFLELLANWGPCP